MSESKTPGPSITWPEDPADAKQGLSEKPTQVKIAVILIWVGAAIALFQTSLIVFTRYFMDRSALNDQIASLLRQQKQPADAQHVNAMIDVLTTMMIVSIVIVLVWAAMAFFSNQGKNWARLAGTALGVLNIGWTLMNGLSPIQLASVLVGFVIIALLWSPSARQWFAGVSQKV